MKDEHPRFYVLHDPLDNTYVIYEDGAGYELGAYYDVPVAECYEEAFAIGFAEYLNKQNKGMQEQ
jgi:hypothetical protein